MIMFCAQGLALVNSFDDFTVVFEADNGRDMQQKIKPTIYPTWCCSISICLKWTGMLLPNGW